MAWIQRLPYEIISYVAENLQLDDVFNLSLSCKSFSFLLTEPSICRAVIKQKAPGSLEAQRADANPRVWPYPRALRTLIKRRRAIAEAEPYLVAVVGFCDSLKYCNGTLLYVRGDELRILDIHNSAKHEIVVDIPRVLRQLIPDYDNYDGDYDFGVVHYAAGIVSCVYSDPDDDPAGTLIVFEPESHAVLFSHQLAAKYRLFVRNTHKYLYYGTHSTIGNDGHRRWQLGAYKLSKETRSWVQIQHIIRLDRFRGNDINSNITFEIINKHFYAVSSISAFNVREVDYNAYFSCLRVPLDKPTVPAAQVTCKGHMWRRNHREGPTDERWSVLRLEENEETREIEVLESRKEWVLGQNRALRTQYRKALRLPHAEAESDGEEEDSEYHHGRLQKSPIRPRCATSVADFEDDETPLSRDPHRVHHNEDGSTLPRKHKTFVRSYHSSCQSFLDFVDDPCETAPGKQRLRIRVGSRKAKKGETARVEGLTTDEAIERLYQDQQIVMWPRYPMANVGEQEARYQRLQDMMNRLPGQVHGTSDDRSIVYSTGGGSNGEHMIVLISFDPSIHLQRVPPWNGRAKIASNTTQRVAQTADLGCVGTSGCSLAQPSNRASGGEGGHRSGECWVRLEAPMYYNQAARNGEGDIEGFDFSA